MSEARTLILVCNSHIDPVWLWPWEEGLAATLATFRAAADLCDEFDGFVFCHNEALLYQWVEEHEPPLFARIRRLVEERRWHVMGGWYLQPDCNLPSGESLVRQVLAGKRYFRDRLGVEPRVAVNLDPFGHARGLVQILAKSGYDGYLFCRPAAAWLPLPADDFTWVGHDGSTLVAHRAADHYNSERGKARQRVERWLAANRDRRLGLLLWGVGNHGGGPSREDLRAIADLQVRDPSRAIVHGRPEDYFDGLEREALPTVASDLNPWAVGCYTSMATVKRAHLVLERSLLAAEAMLANAAVQHLLDYPRAQLREALEDLLFGQFHDVLPGEGVREVERQALERLGHGQEIVGRLRARAFFAMLAGQRKAAEGEHPIFVHNHHPFAVEDVVVCEFQPPEPNADKGTFWQPEITGPDGVAIPVQLEKESSNIQMDHRKRVVFRAALPASATTRFDCRLVPVPRGDAAAAGRAGGPGDEALVHRTDRAEIRLDLATGLLSRYRVDGVECLAAPAFEPLLLCDSADPWGMKVRAFRDVIARFALMSPAAAASFAGVAARELAPVRIVEHGPVRTVVEALLSCGRSAVVLRYKLPARGTEIEVEAAVAWAETDRMLKLSLPTPFAGGRSLRRTAYGVDEVAREEEELAGHRWLALVEPGGGHAVTLVTDSTYGFDVAAGELRVSLLRAPAYAGHPVDDATPIVRQDRYEPREDQGLHTFRFWLNAGACRNRLDAIDREAAVRTGGLMALCAFPPGDGRPARPGVVLEDAVVQLGALKLAEDDDRLVIRLFEPTGMRRSTRVRVPALDLSFDVSLGPHEIKTLVVDPATLDVVETDLLEREVAAR